MAGLHSFARAESETLWSLVVVPQSGGGSNWSHWASTASNLNFTVALSPRELRKISASKDALQTLRKARKLEIAARLNDDPPLPLVDDLELAMNYMSSQVPFGLRMNYREDVTIQIAQARDYFRSQFGEDPKGFVPGNGSLSLAVADALRGQNFAWTLGGFPEGEWKRGSILNAGNSQERVFWVYGVHPVSEMLHDPQWFRGAPRKGPAETQRIVADMLAEISKANQEGSTPMVVFDEKRALVTLDAFLAECAALAGAPGKSRMILASDAGYVADGRSISNSLQIWPHSWSWITGIGSPRGPGLAAWVGDHAKNNAWKSLAEAREKIELYKNSGAADLKKLERALTEIYSAESGDYFEWFGSLEDEPATAQSALRVRQKEKELYFKATLLNVYRHLNVTAPEAIKAVKKISETLPPLAQGTTAPAESPVEPPEDKPLPTAVQMSLADNSLTWTPNGAEGILRKLSLKSGGKPQVEAVEFHFTIQDAPGLEAAVVDLYIDINRRESAGKTALLPGRMASVSSLDAWEYALTCRRSPATKEWDCKLYRSSNSRPILQTTARPRNGKSKSVSWDVAVPKNLLGKEPLRWGYLTCIIKEEGRPIMDFLSPVRNKQKILAEFESLSESAQTASSIVLPLMRAESN